MLEPLVFFLNTLQVVLSRALTGRLLTQREIISIAQEAASRLIMRASEYGDVDPKIRQTERMAEAQNHFRIASSILTEMQSELELQNVLLSKLEEEISSKKQAAAEYAQLASTNQEAAKAMMNQIRSSIALELQKQSKRGQNLRRCITFSIWLITLISGAALGNYWAPIMEWLASLLSSPSPSTP